MRDLRKALMIMATIAGGTSATSLLVVGCGPDNNNGDGGPDATNETGPDVKNDVSNDVSDGGPADVVTDGDGEAGNPLVQFKTDQTNALCKRFQGCCNTLDAGTFDFNKCLGTGVGGWNGSDNELTDEVIARGNVTLDQTAASSCLAGLATLSCPSVTTSEVTTVTPNCFQATSGTLGVGADCVSSIECKKTEYCKFAGVDAGKSDAGTTLGQCATLVAQGQPCGQAPPYGNPNFTSEECEYKNEQPPALFCDYDILITDASATSFTCQPLRANNANCFFDWECSSGICGALNQDCFSTACTCSSSRNYTPFCQALAIKDAGTD